jgi:pimeloyl-ACP methyl ester carboxylesterase
MGIDGPLILVGHSAGGWHVRTFASEFPDRVVGLVLIDSPHEEFEGRRNAVLSEVERAERQASLRTMRSNLAEEHRLEYEGIDQTPRALWQRPLPDVPLVVLAAEIHDWVPTRTAQAQDEAWHEFQVRLSKLTEHGRLELVRGGHNIQLDRPEVVIRIVERMVEQVGPSQTRKNGR